MASSYVEVGSGALMELKDNLSKLSKTLHDIYDLMNADMTQVGQAWQDGKYEEFIEGYKPQIAKCDEIAQRYETWCVKALEPAIEETLAYEGVDVSGGSGSSGGGVSGSGSSGGTNQKPMSKAALFLQGINRVHELEEKDTQDKIIMKKASDATGADPRERERISSQILSQLLNGKGR